MVSVTGQMQRHFFRLLKEIFIQVSRVQHLLPQGQHPFQGCSTHHSVIKQHGSRGSDLFPLSSLLSKGETYSRFQAKQKKFATWSIQSTRSLQKLENQSQNMGTCIHFVSLSPATYSGSCEEGDLNEEMVPILLHFIVNWYHTNTHSPHNPHNYPEKKYHYPPVTDEKND